MIAPPTSGIIIESKMNTHSTLLSPTAQATLAQLEERLAFNMQGLLITGKEPLPQKNVRKMEEEQPVQKMVEESPIGLPATFPKEGCEDSEHFSKAKEMIMSNARYTWKNQHLFDRKLASQKETYARQHQEVREKFGTFPGLYRHEL